MTAEDLSQILDELGRRLGPAGEYAFGLAVRWQITAGLFGLALGLIGIAACIGFCRFIWSKSEDWDSSVDRPMTRVITIAIASATVAVLLVVVADSSLRLLNPEYAALRDLIGVIR